MKTYLYIKQHNETKLKYFGKTAVRDPYEYNGSGKLWLRHIKKHGDNISTLEVFEFNDLEECERFAIEFSLKNNIVESKDWANLIVENGRDGKTPGSPGLKKEKNPNFGKTKELNPFYGKKHSEENLKKFKSTTRAKNSNSKRCRTPLGEFECMLDAADAHGVIYETLRKWFKNNKPGFQKNID